MRQVNKHKSLRVARLILLSAVVCLAFVGSARCQINAGEGLEIRGNHPEINVSVRDSSGELVAAPATVKLYRDGAPYQQGSTSKGQIFFILNNFGDFTVFVEAAGYKTARQDVTISVAVKAEVDVNLQRETSPNFTPGPAGGPILAPKAREALDKGLQAIRDDKLDEADRSLDQAMKLAPSNAEVLYADGVLQLKKHDWAKAQTVLEKATQIDPNHARSYAALGMALCNEKKYQEAVAPLEKALQMDANSGWETHLSLAQSYYHLERYEEALKVAEQARTESNGQAAQVDLLVAQSLVAVGKYEDAADVLRELLKRHGDGPEAATAQRFLERLTADGKIRKQ